MPTLSLSLPSPPPPMTSITSTTTTLSPFPSTLFTLHPPRPLLLSHHSHSLHPLLKPLPFPTLSLTHLSRFTPRAKFDSDYSNEAEAEDEDEVEDEYEEDEDEDEDEYEDEEDEDEEDEDEEDEDDEEYEEEEEDDKEDYEDEEEVEDDEDEDEDLEIDLERPITETEEEIAMAYEEIYGPGWSGESFLGNDVLEMDSEIEPEKIDSWGMDEEEMKILDGFEERVLQVRRITKVVKGGKILRFRAIVVAGNKKGKVGVGHGKAVEIIDAVRKAALDARRHLVKVPMTKYMTFPHRVEAKFGAAKVMLRPAGPGTGVLAGRTIKDILELAGIQNAMAKQIGSPNVLNNARAAIVGISQMKTFSEVALQRGIPMEELWK